MYDVVVVGGGHAGCEAAAAASRLGAAVALLTLSRRDLGRLSCNPAIGGLGKGHLVREIDALDGLMARVADASAIHCRLLNRSKGPAVQGPRVQVDRRHYAAQLMRLVGRAGVTIIEGGVVDLIGSRSSGIGGVRLEDGRCIVSAATVLTTGTFLGGRMHRGARSQVGGRVGKRAPTGLEATLRGLGLDIARLKTGTPPRLDGRTIDWAALERQSGDDAPTMMSAWSKAPPLPQVACAVTRTTSATHAIIREHLHSSAMYNGTLDSRGPRYCPSIEDKIARFGDRDGHQVFLEPEGLDDHLVYPNGISTALPAEAQALLVASLPGCERARIVRHGYAVAYDHVDARQLGLDLAVLGIDGLFLAGQINGTTGYEEAAAQGLLAGVNAARRAGGATTVTVDRATAYLGVLVDDLVTHGTSEPYRMFTSRAEYRLRLRIDNADARLTPLGERWGCVGSERARQHCDRARERAAARTLLAAAMASPARMARHGVAVSQDGAVRSAFEWLGYPRFDWATARAIWSELEAVPLDVGEEVATDARYAEYVARQDADVAALVRDEALALPTDLAWAELPGVSREAAEKLALARPATLGAAARVGVGPGALTALLAHVRRVA